MHYSFMISVCPKCVYLALLTLSLGKKVKYFGFFQQTVCCFRAFFSPELT